MIIHNANEVFPETSDDTKKSMFEVLCIYIFIYILFNINLYFMDHDCAFIIACQQSFLLD